MEQAIKDKTAMVEAEMMAEMQAAENFHLNQADSTERHAFEQEEIDPDFQMDEEEEAMMRKIAEQRLADARADFQEERTNITHGHGTYVEITE